MKILVLNGSPTANGNTVAMVKAFEEGAQAAGHTVQVVSVANKHVNGCRGCGYCRTKGNGTCIQKDDMQELYPIIRDAEAIVFASPVYYFTLTAQLQSVIHRFFAFGKLPWVKKMGMLLSSGSPNVYEACDFQLKCMTGFLGIESVGTVTAFGSENKTEAKMNEVKEFAKKF